MDKHRPQNDYMKQSDNKPCGSGEPNLSRASGRRPLLTALRSFTAKRSFIRQDSLSVLKSEHT